MYNIVFGFCIFGIVKSSTINGWESKPSGLTLALRGASVSPTNRMSPGMKYELERARTDSWFGILKTVPDEVPTAVVSRGTPPIPILDPLGSASYVYVGSPDSEQIPGAYLESGMAQFSVRYPPVIKMEQPVSVTEIIDDEDNIDDNDDDDDDDHNDEEVYRLFGGDF